VAIVKDQAGPFEAGMQVAEIVSGERLDVAEIGRLELRQRFAAPLMGL
jgi:hypothetical protein